jgi:hypothetical protein
MKSRIVRRVLTAAVLAAALGVAASAVPVQAAVNQWRLVYRSHTQGDMTGVVATGPANAWAVGYHVAGPAWQIVNQLFVVHWDGKAWRTVTVPGGDGFIATAVAASSARNVWIFGQSDVFPFNKAVFIFDGAHWRSMPAPAGFTYAGSDGAFSVAGAPLVLSASDVWMPTGFSSCSYPRNAAPQCVSTLWHWDGHTWKQYDIGASIDSLAGVAHNDVLAVGVAWQKSQLEAGTTVAYRWNGTRWGKVIVPRTPVYGYSGVGMDSARDVWICAGTLGGNAAFAMHWNGLRWSRTPMTGGMIGLVVVPDGHGGVWAGDLSHWTGRSWIDASNWAAPLAGLGGADLAKIPGTSSSYWGSGQLSVDNTGNGYPGVMIYGLLP